MTTEDAKTYLSKRDIPRLFESLMTGLMYHRPQDHIKYLIECLQKVHDKGQENITWSSFVDIRRNKTPLPPIANGTARPSSKGSRPSSRTKAPAVTRSRRLYREDKTPQREKTSSPLPAIPTSTAEKVNLPDIPIIMVVGAPGSGKDGHVDRLLKRYPDFQHLNVGKLIKEEIQRRGDAQAKWKLTNDLLSRGEAAPQDVTVDVLIQGLKKASSSAKGIIVTGYPRSMEQVGDYARFISRVDVVFIIDCDESKAMDKLLRKGRNSNRPEDSMSAITNRMNYFKAHTLPAAKYYDDLGKLVIIEGDGGEDVTQHKLGESFDELFFRKYGKHKQESAPPKSAGSAGSNVPEPATYSKKQYEKEDSTLVEEEKPLFTGAVPLPPIITEADTGRKPDLPQCPIVFVAGGPGSGKGTQCARIVQRYPEFVHISMGDIIRTEISSKGTADDKWDMISKLVSKGEMAPEDVTVELLKEQLKKHGSAKAFLIEGFPRDKVQVEAFNNHIGGLNFVILFDCEEYYMQTRLLKRGRESGRIDDNPSAIANKLNNYKYNTLPVMKYFDDAGKLVVRNIADLDADRDMDSMFYDISQMFDFAFFGRQPGKEGRNKKDDKVKAAMQIQAGLEAHRARSSKGSDKSQETDDDKLKAKGSSVTYMTEAKADGLDDETAMAALRIKAGFEGGKKRQQKILRSGASYSSKHDSDRQSDKSDVSANTTQAASQLMAAFAGYKQRSSKDDKKQTGSEKVSGKAEAKQGPSADKAKAADQIIAGFEGYKQRLNKEKQKKVGDKTTDGKDKSKEASNQIATALKGMQSRQTNKKSSDEKINTEEEQKQAAERIQAGFRGYQTRLELQAKLQQGKQDTEAPVQDAIVEESITQETAKTTGDNVENPSHSQKLDEAAES